MGEHETRHPVGERRLADPGRPADQPGVRQPSRAIGVEQRALGLGVAVERGGRARRQHFAGIVVGLAHEAASCSETGAIAGWSRSFTAFQIRSATFCLSSVELMTTQREDSIIAIRR